MKIIKCAFVDSSVDKAVSDAEKYFGTVAQSDTVSCQDVITEKDADEIRKIADDNKVLPKVGRYSVTFVDVEKYLDDFTNVLE